MTNDEIVSRLNELFEPGTLGFIERSGCNLEYPCGARLSRGEIVIDCKQAHETTPGASYSLERAMSELEDFRQFYKQRVEVREPEIQHHSNPLFGSW